MTPIVRAILGHTETRGECPACGSVGMPGASCDTCVRAAYQREINRVRQCQIEAYERHRQPSCDLSKMLHGAWEALLAGLVGHDLIRESLPYARMQAPGAP